jgi:plastocyanin
MRWKGVVSLLASTGLFLAIPPVTVGAAGGAPTVTIGVGHADFPNQNPFQNRVFEYTDFFSRDVSVHAGDLVDFRTAPSEFHSIALAPAVLSLPLFLADTDDAPARGTGVPKITGGPALPLAFSGPTCGAFGRAACTFDGSRPVNSGAIAGFSPTGPSAVDWNVQIGAGTPIGTYHYFCYLHPGMQGVLHVVPSTDATTTQADIDSASNSQFAADRGAALALEAADTHAGPSSGAPGSRTWTVHVGDTTSDNHVAILEMMPQSLPNVVSGDAVNYVWGALEPHTVGFGPDANLPEPFGWDCGRSFVGFSLQSGPGAPPACAEIEQGRPEIIGDPGTRGSGEGLNLQQLTDSGLLVGSAYRASPSSQFWSVAAARPGTYAFHCTVHDFMVGSLTVGGT